MANAAMDIHIHMVAQWVENPPAVQEIQVQFLAWEDPHDNPLQYSCLENPTDKRSLVSYSP